MPYATHSDGTSIYYEQYGTGTPIVFIHPPAMGHVTFKRQRPLSENFCIITVDLRGNGRSGIHNKEITMSLLAEDILAVIDKARLRKVVVCGYSNGGSVAQEFALKYPARVSGVILCGGFPEVNSFLLRNEFRLGIYTAKFKLMKLLSFVLSTAHAKKLYKMELDDYIRKTDPEVLMNMYNEGLHYRSTNRLHELTVPLLLVYGARDFYVHHYQSIFKEKVNTPVDIVYISNASHQIPTKQDQQLNHIIKKFIENRVEKNV